MCRRLTVDGVSYYHNASLEKVTYDKPDELKTAEELKTESGEWVWIADDAEARERRVVWGCLPAFALGAWRRAHERARRRRESLFLLLAKEASNVLSVLALFFARAQAWMPARVLSRTASGVTAEVHGSGKHVTVEQSERNPLWPVALSSLTRLEDDMVMCDEVNQAMMVHDVKERFKRDEIYTWVGASHTVLVRHQRPTTGRDLEFYARCLRAG